MAKRKLRAARARDVAAQQAEIVHDRRAQVAETHNNLLRTVTVDDPYEYGAKITVIASMRDDPLGRMHARSQIDDAQYCGGREYQRLYELVQVGPLKAMDTTNEPVDGGGRIPEFSTDARLRASKVLARLDRALGYEGCGLIRHVLVDRLFLEQAAAARGLASNRGIAYVGKRFRECLETLAKNLSLA